ncbi:MAG: DUF456 domain-containing protein [Proteobacteria bacterium]|nr:DUF456 domain-containing protein [Pseudomonadota bacterium]
MEVLPHLILIVCCLAGVAGSALPAVPGALVIFGGALLHGIWTGWEPIGPFILTVLALLTVISWGVSYAVTAFGAKKSGASNWGVLGATIGMFMGLAIPIPVLNMLIGAFIGALGTELLVRWIKLQNLPEEEVDPSVGVDGGSAAKAGLGAAVGAIVGLMAEMGVAILMVGVVVTPFAVAGIKALFN